MDSRGRLGHFRPLTFVRSQLTCDLKGTKVTIHIPTQLLSLVIYLTQRSHLSFSFV
ncbi:MAG: hypothetical protein ACEY26_00525 [Candidatus Hodgkinia cicadicola]